jgi:hypothetical protein
MERLKVEIRESIGFEVLESSIAGAYELTPVQIYSVKFNESNWIKVSKEDFELVRQMMKK